MAGVWTLRMGLVTSGKLEGMWGWGWSEAEVTGKPGTGDDVGMDQELGALEPRLAELSKEPPPPRTPLPASISAVLRGHRGGLVKWGRGQTDPDPLLQRRGWSLGRGND